MALNDCPTVKEPKESIKIIPREKWKPDPMPRPMDRMRYPLFGVFITITGGRTCKTESSCLKEIRDLQLYHLRNGMFDIPFNFLIGGDGKIYEGRGWYWGSLLPYTTQDIIDMRKHPLQDKSMVIAQMGKTIHTDLTHPQAKGTEDLIEYGLQNNKIIPDYQRFSQKYWVQY